MAHEASLNTKSVLEETPLGKCFFAFFGALRLQYFVPFYDTELLVFKHIQL